MIKIEGKVLLFIAMLAGLIFSALLGAGGVSAAAPSKPLRDCLGDSACTQYYANIDKDATNDDLKGQLQSLIYPHTILDYDDVWGAFAVVDHYLPTYPCDPNNSTMIPDIYSTYCWSPDKSDPGGECGNYKQEGDCYNREHIWPKICNVHRHNFDE